jgi:hypothetical protein
MRRSLVLTDETARHWFRMGLPPHVKSNLIPIPAEALWRRRLRSLPLLSEGQLVRSAQGFDPVKFAREAR